MMKQKLFHLKNVQYREKSVLKPVQIRTAIQSIGAIRYITCLLNAKYINNSAIKT